MRELQALTPDFSWDDYLKTVNSPATKHYLVATPDFFKNLDSLINSASVDDWKTYLRWHAVRSAAALLSQPFVEENFSFQGKYLNGAKELPARWKRCVQSVNHNLG